VYSTFEVMAFISF